MDKTKRTLSIRSIRSAAKKSKDAEPGLDAMWSAAGWLVPVQVIGLLVGEVGFWSSLGAALGMAIGLAVAAPLTAGVVSAFTKKPTADRVAWLCLVLLAGAAWQRLGGAVVAVPLAVLALLLFGVFHSRYRARDLRQAYGMALPADLAHQITQLPKKLAHANREPIDVALASLESLHALHRELPEGEELLSDATACLRRMIARTHTVLQLRALPLRSPETDRARRSIEAEIDDLTTQLKAAVDAASRFIAVGPSSAREELAERALALHALAEATEEVEATLRVAGVGGA